MRSKQPSDDNPTSRSSSMAESREWLRRLTTRKPSRVPKRRRPAENQNVTRERGEQSRADREPRTADASRGAAGPPTKQRNRPGTLQDHFSDTAVAEEFGKKYRDAYRLLVEQGEGDPPKHKDVARELGLSAYRLRQRLKWVHLSWPPKPRQATSGAVVPTLSAHAPELDRDST